MQLDPLEMLNGDIDPIPISSWSHRKRILLLILLAVDLERLLSSWWVDDFARRLETSSSCTSGYGRLGRVSCRVGGRVIDLGL